MMYRFECPCCKGSHHILVKEALFHEGVRFYCWIKDEEFTVRLETKFDFPSFSERELKRLKRWDPGF